MKKIVLVSLVTLAAAFTLTAADPAPAAAKPAKEAKAPAKARARPFSATIKALDQTAKTVSLSGEKEQVLQITSETVIKKDQKPATLEDLKVGDSIAGSLRENEGKLDAVTINDGKPTKVAKPAGDKPAMK